MGATAASLGTVLLKRGPRAGSRSAPTPSARAIGAVMSGAFSVALGEPHAPADDASAAAWPLLYLTVAGSLGAYVIMSWLVNHWPVTRTAYVTVIVPVIALALGSVARHERLTAASFGAPPSSSSGCSSACARAPRRAETPDAALNGANGAGHPRRAVSAGERARANGASTRAEREQRAEAARAGRGARRRTPTCRPSGRSCPGAGPADRARRPRGALRSSTARRYTSRGTGSSS